MPNPDEIAELTRVVHVMLTRVREMQTAANEAVNVTERDAVLLLYKADVKVTAIPSIVGMSYNRVYEVINGANVKRRNKYPRERPGKHAIADDGASATPSG